MRRGSVLFFVFIFSVWTMEGYSYVLYGTKWGAQTQFNPDTPPASSGGVVTYGFPPTGHYGSIAHTHISEVPQVPECVAQMIRNAFGVWSDVSNIEFREVVDNGSPINDSGNNADIRIWLEDRGGFARASLPPEGDLFMRFRDVQDCSSTDQLVTWQHEIGHAIGLLHDPCYPLGTNQSVMSYCRNGPNDGRLSADDIKGAIAIYGASPGYSLSDQYDRQPPVLSANISDSGASSLNISGGQASDSGGSGIENIEYLVQNTDSGEYLDAQGKVIPREPRHLTVINNFSNTDFGLVTSISAPGNYRVFLRATDLSGNVSDWLVLDTYIDGSSEMQPIDSDNPDIEFDYTIPIMDAIVRPSAKLGGQVHDLSSITSVQYLLRRLSDYSYVSLNGTQVDWQPTDAVTAALDSSTVLWSVQLENLPIDTYRIYVRATDSYQNTSEWETLDFKTESYGSSDPVSRDEIEPSLTMPENRAYNSNENLSGFAIDAESGVKRVDFQLRDLSDFSYIDVNANSMQWAPQSASVDGATWEVPVSLPDGIYRIYARGIDNAGNISDWEFGDFTVRSADSTAPEIFINTGEPETPYQSGSQVFAGVVTDSGSGTSSVQFMLRERVSFDYVDVQGNAASWGPVNASLGAASGDDAEWTITTSLPDGMYRLYLRAIDTVGNVSDWKTRDFSISSGDAPPPNPVASDQIEPSLTLPWNEVYEFGEGVSGFAADAESGVKRVDYQLRDLSDFSYISSMGSVGGWNPRAAILDGGSWEIPITLPDGKYRVYVRGVDYAGNASDWEYADFTVRVVDDSPPDVTIDLPASFNESSVDNILKGSAADLSSGIESVQYLIRDLSDYTYVDAQGDVIPWMPREVSSFASGEWSVNHSLPKGEYRVYVRAIDKAGNVSVWDYRDFTVVAASSADTSPPTSYFYFDQDEVLDPAYGIFLDSEEVVVTAIYGIETIQYMLRALADFTYVDTSGNDNGWGPVNVDSVTFYSQDGSQWGYWFLDIPELPVGHYRLYVRAIDVSGNVEIWKNRDFFVE